MSKKKAATKRTPKPKCPVKPNPGPELVCVPQTVIPGNSMRDRSELTPVQVVIRNIDTPSGKKLGDQMIPIFDTAEDYLAWRNAPLTVGDRVMFTGFMPPEGIVTRVNKAIIDVFITDAGSSHHGVSVGDTKRDHRSAVNRTW